MIIALEGVPAVGKTTIAKILASDHGFYRVPEVNELFPMRPNPEPVFWYAERQIERATMATTHQRSVLDGDIFQVVWFSWIYPDMKLSDLATTMDMLLANRTSIQLPSFYCYLHVANDCRYDREYEREKARGRSQEQFQSKFDRYADMLEPQKALFEAMDREFPGWVLFHENTSAQQAVHEILGKRLPEAPDILEYLAWLKQWLLQNDSSLYKMPRI